MRESKAFTVSFSKLKKFIGELFSKKNRKRLIELLVNPDESDARKAFSVGFGIFMGITPIWGLQTLAAIFLAVVFKLNKALVLIFTHVSFAPFLPVILFLSYKTGQFWVGGSSNTIALHAKPSFSNISGHLGQYIYGSLTLAIVAGVLAGIITYALLRLTKLVKQYRLSAA